MQKLISNIKRLLFFLPFTGYFVAFALLIVFGYRLLDGQSKLPDSGYKVTFSLLLSIALLICIAVLLFGFITVLISFIYAMMKARKQIQVFHLETEINKNINSKGQIVKIKLHPILSPLIGFLKIRLLYDENSYSAKYTPIVEKNNIFNLTFEGRFNWDLPEIREYHIKKAVLYFEDYFQFFSFSVSIRLNQHFHIGPQTEKLNSVNANPRKTEETSIRIEELKRVEGELINYKNFETNDDVRRIVWKIYAKNKELVVRIPEILDPYASHIYLYASFFNAFNIKSNRVIQSTLLDYYKTICWSIYTQLAQKGFEVKFVSDQSNQLNKTIESADLINHAITISNWQSDNELKDYVKTVNASVVIVSSLIELEQVKQFAESNGDKIQIIHIPLSEIVSENAIKSWFRWLFIKTENDSLESNKMKWKLSPIRFKIKTNETQIRKVLNQNRINK